MTHHVAERRVRLPARVRNEVEVAQLRAIRKHEAIEPRKQRRIVELELQQAREVLMRLMVEDQEAYAELTAARKLPADSPERLQRLPIAVAACIRCPAAAEPASSAATVSAVASSGPTVSFTTTTPSVCSSGGANGATITLAEPGTCTVEATQAGNATYNAATPVYRGFTVSRR